ncbi:hypothetical protein MBLNU457_5238t1 [Dothideomycetes sp. NU457]
MCGSDIFLGILALLFPPLPVWVKRGICSADSLINLALCCLGVLPGLLHAWYIILQYPEATYEEVPQQDAENGRVTYYYIDNGDGQGQRRVQGAPPQRGYGTVPSAPDQQFRGQQAGVAPPAQYQNQAVMGGESSEGLPPPSYQESVKGDNKVQRS